MEVQLLHHVANKQDGVNLRVELDKNEHPSHVVYKGKCICGQTYIGETASNLEVWVNEQSDVNKQSEPAKYNRKHPNHKFMWPGSLNHGLFVVKKENKRGVLHRTLLSRTK